MPQDLKCPNCQKPSIGFWQKQFLGPARTIDCSLCGVRVSVSTLHFIPILLFLIFGIPILRKLGLMEYGFASYAGALAFYLLVIGSYQHYLVPLVVRYQRTNK